MQTHGSADTIAGGCGELRLICRPGGGGTRPGFGAATS
jgi:hypothetical protein